jgi:hypothetical protein
METLRRRRLKLGFVLAMKDIFVRPQLLEADVVRSIFKG